MATVGVQTQSAAITLPAVLGEDRLRFASLASLALVTVVGVPVSDAASPRGASEDIYEIGLRCARQLIAVR
jgi:biotin transporter BioY